MQANKRSNPHKYTKKKKRTEKINTEQQEREAIP